MPTDATRKSLTSALLHGSAWMIGMRWALRLVGLLSTAVLARLLVPADFGIVAMAAVVAGLLETAAYAGVDLALIRADSDAREFRDSAWTIQILQACLIAVLLVIAAPFTAAYYHEPRVALVIQCLAVKAVIEGFQNIGVVAFRKELDFSREFRFNVYSKLLNLVMVIAAALWFRNYLALVTGMVSGAAVTVALSYLMHPYRPRLTLSAGSSMWSFSNWLLVSRIGTFMSRKVDQFIIGGAVGPTALGSYHVATELSTLPTMEFVMPVRRALFPALSMQQGDPVAFRATVLQAFAASALVCFATGVGLMNVASEVVLIVLGEQWRGTIPLVRLLALYGAFAGLTSVLEAPIWAAGKTHISAIQSWLELLLVAPGLVIAVRVNGVEGAAATRMAVSVIMLPVMLVLASRTCRIGIVDFAATIWRPFVAAALMTAVLSVPVALRGGAIGALAVKVAVGAATYGIVLLILWRACGKPEGIESAVMRRLRFTA